MSKHFTTMGRKNFLLTEGNTPVGPGSGQGNHLPWPAEGCGEKRKEERHKERKSTDSQHSAELCKHVGSERRWVEEKCAVHHSILHEILQHLETSAAILRVCSGSTDLVLTISFIKKVLLPAIDKYVLSVLSNTVDDPLFLFRLFYVFLVSWL